MLQFAIMKIIKPLQAAAIKLLLRVLVWLPFRVVQAIGKGLGWCAFWLPSSVKKVAQYNIALCFPELTPEERCLLLRQAFMETFCTFFEWPALWLWPAAKRITLMKAVQGEDILFEALHEQRGVIIAMPHLGAWEAIKCYAPSHYKGLVMYRPPRLQELHSFMLQAREHEGSWRLVPANTAGVKAMFRTLKQGGIVIILPDQVPHQQGVIAPFFGVPASTIDLVQRLSQKTGARILYQYIERLGVGRGFHLHFEAASPLLADADPLIAVQALNEGIEKCVRKIPAQYQWFYKRFKKNITH